jgi:hypothetical protein
MSVCCECCVLSGRGIWDELTTRSEESHWLRCVVVCDLETSFMRSQTSIVIGLKKQEIYHWKYLLHATNSQAARQLIEYCVLWLLIKRDKKVYWTRRLNIVLARARYWTLPSVMSVHTPTSLQPNLIVNQLPIFSHFSNWALHLTIPNKMLLNFQRLCVLHGSHSLLYCLGVLS